jgi:hypothetical protein
LVICSIRFRATRISGDRAHELEHQFVRAKEHCRLSLRESSAAFAERKATIAACEWSPDLETFVSRIVTESVVGEERPANKKQSAEEFARRLDAWIAMHPAPDHAIDDSRE